MGGGLGPLDAVALHGSALLVETQEPGPPRLLLAVQQRAVHHVVALEHRLLEARLGCVELLGGGGGGEGASDRLLYLCVKTSYYT